MTLEQVKALTDEELRIKVAELLGWVVESFGNGIICYNEELDKQRPPEDDGIRFELPNYPADLNACAELDKGLSGGAAYLEYVDNLFKVLGMTEDQRGDEFWSGNNNDLMAVHNATARQRCEAFTLTRTR